MRIVLASLAAIALVRPANAQRPLNGTDSALIARILTAEDRRDAASPALREGANSLDPRVRLLAARAGSRIRDPKFTGRDSFPNPVAPPTYYDPAWRLRYRALATQKADCAALNAGLADQVWAVRLRAADLIGAECTGDSTMVKTLRDWVEHAPVNAVRGHDGVSWQPAAHAIVALTRVSPPTASGLIRAVAENPVPWLRTYAARAAGAVKDTLTLRNLAHDRDPNVQEAAIDALVRTEGHGADHDYIDALSSNGFQVVRAAARALKGSPRPTEAIAPLIAAARRVRRDSSETSRDARLALVERLDEFATPANATDIAALAKDFDCQVAQASASVATRLAGKAVFPTCSPMPINLPRDAVALALGRTVRLRVTLADSSGGGSFTVRLRGDVAPIMAARVLALARSGYYNGLVWHRIEPDFVLQGGGLGANEYVGNPRFMRDELGMVPHVRGTVGMSTRGHDTGDGQWFVNLRDNLRLNADYTVFAEVVDGIEVVDGVLEGDVIVRIDVVGT
jgi:cyclophilin family peptidyl-prolyl cis-trans isomerase